MATVSDPILSCADVADFERRLFGEDEEAAWAAMRRAGLGVAAAVLCDIEEIGGLPGRARVLVLAGKGHNCGDALIAAGSILEGFPGAAADVVFAFGERALRPLAKRAWREFADAFGDRVRVVPREQAGGEASAGPTAYDLSLDGVFGYQFRPPVDPQAGAVLGWANRIPVRLRAAVDLPSGPGDPSGFLADFTYATGIVKAPLLACGNAGRLRYVDLGFFAKAVPELGAAEERVLKPSVMGPLCVLRQPRTDKRDYGHLLVVGGSRGYPGAVLMSVLAALRSGVGLVTALVPESLAAAYAECAFTVYPSIAEGFGLPVIESLAHGRPCVCSARGALGELSLLGGCVPLASVDASSLAAAIAELLASPAERARLAADAQARKFKRWNEYARELTTWMRTLRRAS